MHATHEPATYPPRNSKLIAEGIEQDEAHRLAVEHRPAAVCPAFAGGFEVWALGR